MTTFPVSVRWDEPLYHQLTNAYVGQFKIGWVLGFSSDVFDAIVKDADGNPHNLGTFPTEPEAMPAVKRWAVTYLTGGA